VQIRRIAEEHGIPPRFLVQILAQLKSAGLVTSVRGAGGGYLLNRPPTSVTLLDVLTIMEGDDEPTTNCAKSTPLCTALLELRQELCQAQRDRLESTTLADLAEQATSTAEPMWYI
jgi:Rrf2 family protein